MRREKPILYAGGRNYDRRACARVTFPDQRWLRFAEAAKEAIGALELVPEDVAAVQLDGLRMVRIRPSPQEPLHLLVRMCQGGRRG
jgi:hypothetical protein